MFSYCNYFLLNFSKKIPILFFYEVKRPSMLKIEVFFFSITASKSIVRHKNKILMIGSEFKNVQHALYNIIILCMFIYTYIHVFKFPLAGRSL